MKDAIMLDDHEVNKEKLKRFLTEVLLTGDWSNEFDLNEYGVGVSYWRHIYNLGLIASNNGFKLTTAGRAWLDEQRN